MAIINSLAIGAAKGSAGNLTYTRNAGRTIARAKTTTVKNPNTPEQQLQRGKMKEAVVLYNALASALKGSFAGRKRTLSVFNAFVSANVGAMSGTTNSTIEAILAAKPEIKINGNLGKITADSSTGKVSFASIKHKLFAGDKITVFSVSENGAIEDYSQTALTTPQIQAGEYTGATSANLVAFGAFITTKDGRKSTESVLSWA